MARWRQTRQTTTSSLAPPTPTPGRYARPLPAAAAPAVAAAAAAAVLLQVCCLLLRMLSVQRAPYAAAVGVLRCLLRFRSAAPQPPEQAASPPPPLPPPLLHCVQVPESSGPGPKDPSTLVWMYHSHTSESGRGLAPTGCTALLRPPQAACMPA